MSRSLLEVYDAFIAKEVHRFCAMYNIKHDDFDDYMQQARLGVLEFAKKHDMNPDEMTALDHHRLKTEIFYYLYKYMCKDHLVSGINSENIKKVPKELKTYLPLECAMSYTDQEAERQICDSEVLSFRFKNPTEIKLFIEGYNYGDIAKMLNKKSFSVRYKVRIDAERYFS